MQLPFDRRLSSLCLVALAAALPPHASAQAPASPQTGSGKPAPPADQTGISLRGQVADPDDAVIPGATITLTPANGRPITTTSAADGSYKTRVTPGVYTLTATMPGFAPYIQQGVRIGTQPLTINMKLAIQDEKTVVNVTANQATVSVDQDSNASATVLKGKDLDALSDDPDELSSELSALAGPAAGPNGGQIYIDGFTGGQLPPKSSIREIRVNQNPFSAQFDRVGFGRVEVFTKPGTDKFHGSVQLNGADRSFNTGSPYITAGTPQPDYHSVFGFGSVTGPINKKASFTLSGSYRNIQDNTVVDPPAIYATSASDKALCAPGQQGCKIFSITAGNGFNSAQFVPATRWDISPRVDIALGEKNTLTVRFQYEHNKQENGNIGGADLFSTGINNNSAEGEIQISDTQIISAKIINETRFEYNRGTSDSTPFSLLPSLNVQGAFVAGGNSSGRSADVQHHIELQNYTSVALAKHFLRMGGRLRTTSETSTTASNQNGTFTYNSIDDYSKGTVSQFSITNIATPTLSARGTDVGLYAEDDWKVRPNLTFSYGLRFETQNFIHDHADFAPRVSTAYGLSKKTVLRAGFGIFYDRFSLGNEFNVFRNNGINQQSRILSAKAEVRDANGVLITPAVPISPACNPGNIAGCSGAQANGRVITRIIDSRLRAPYSMQFNAGVDQQITKTATISINYQHIRGVHQFNSAFANPENIANPLAPLTYEYQSEGIFNQNQLIANGNFRGFKNASFFGYYVLNFAKSNAGGANQFASQTNNLSADYGRAGFDVRHRMFLGGNFTLPHLISVSPLLVAFSGSPYNITTGTDVNNNTIYNDRAVLLPAGLSIDPKSLLPGQFVKTIGNCGTFATPGIAGLNSTTPAPINYCTGPANFSMNLRVNKTFGFGPLANPDARPQGGGDGGGRGGPPGGDRRGGGGGRGNIQIGGGGGASSRRKYNVSLGAQAQNLFNIVDRSTPVGTLSSNSFGTSTQLAGGFLTTDSAVRRISLQASFSF